MTERLHTTERTDGICSAGVSPSSHFLFQPTQFLRGDVVDTLSVAADVVGSSFHIGDDPERGC